MGYTAYKKMREINKTRWELDGPAMPEMFTENRIWEKDENGRRKSAPSFCRISDLEYHAVNFIRERCEDLRFDRQREDRVNLRDFDGKSLREGQVPYNFQMDSDRRCLEVAIHRFLESGVAKDAFDVYFCYLEMFIGSYGRTKKMIEMLSEFEANASSLLMKHRDHYSHSVYVFLIGLAFYDSSDNFRAAYKAAYGFLLQQEQLDFKLDQDLAAHFLKYWGLTALFHDIGYPFELAFEQVKSYFGNTIQNVPYVTFCMNLPDSERYNKFLAKALYDELGEDYAKNAQGKLFNAYESFLKEHSGTKDCGYLFYLEDVLRKKPEHPEKFGGFIDHAYFSATELLKTLERVLEENELGEMYSHALTAILLHNSLYKFSITNYKKKDNTGRHFTLQRSPLAYLLMLCDELQCWDRTSYGRNSRGEVHPFDCELTFEGDEIQAVYLFDRNLYADGDEIRGHFKGVKGTYEKLCIKEDKEKPVFLEDIEHIVSLNGDNSFGCTNRIRLKVGKRFEANRRFRNSSISSTNFIHMYRFAVLVHEMNHLEENGNKCYEDMEREFNRMSLEYKMNHIGRAKKFAKVLKAAGYFYSDKPVDCELVTELGSELDEKMGPVEHERWCFEHYIMGWRSISKEKLDQIVKKEEGENKEDTKPAVGWVRECVKRHPSLFEVREHYEKQTGLNHYLEIGKEEQHKDTRSINNLMQILAREDGIKVYRI